MKFNSIDDLVAYENLEFLIIYEKDNDIKRYYKILRNFIYQNHDIIFENEISVKNLIDNYINSMYKNLVYRNMLDYDNFLKNCLKEFLDIKTRNRHMI